MDEFGERLERARRRRFVGRGVELDWFRDVLATPERAGTTTFICGPFGTGKSLMLGVMAEIAAAGGARVVHIDANSCVPTPSGLLAAISDAIGNAGRGVGLMRSLAQVEPLVLLIDSYEIFAQHDDWIRVQLLAALPSRAYLVLATRQSPGWRWLAGSAWRDMLHVVQLKNFTRAETETYLAAEHLPVRQQRGLRRLSHGRPLTLSLLVGWLKRNGEAPQDFPRSLADVPEITRVLIGQVVNSPPSAAHCQALHICVHARFTTEDLLAAVVDEGDAAELFEWLRGMPFVIEHPRGLLVHVVVRDILDADMRWRSPSHYARLHRSIRDHLVESLEADVTWQAVLDRVADLAFVARLHPAVVPLIGQSDGLLHGRMASSVTESEHPAVIELTYQHQGRKQADLVAYWLGRQPDAFCALRGQRGQVIGYGCLLSLSEVAQADEDVDPGVAAMSSFARRNGALRSEEQALAWRFLIDSTDDQPSASLVPLAAWRVQAGQAQRCSWDFVGVAEDADAWEPLMTYLGYRRIVEADYAVDTRTFRVFGRATRSAPRSCGPAPTGSRTSPSSSVASRRRSSAASPSTAGRSAWR